MKRTSVAQSGSFLTQLRRDRRGNTIAIMAAAMVPLLGFTGSAIDMARLYVVKVRLQQACDAGVLAGRKAMTDTSLITPLAGTAKTQADTFFANNFVEGWFKTQNVVFTPVKAADGLGSTVANAVTGTASVSVPMSVMGFFGFGAKQIAVKCQARYDLADTDVMFVLDTTGSMSCYPSDPADCSNSPITPYQRDDYTTGYYAPEKPAHTLPDGTTEYSRLESVRRAVTLFDETMRANKESTSHYRYGFVPYSSSVNVGYTLAKDFPQYLQSTSWTYQSRRLSPTTNGTAYPNSAGDYNAGATQSVSLTGIPQSFCQPQRSPVSGFTKTGLTWGDQGYFQARYYYNLTWTAANGGTCSGTEQPLRQLWRYEPVSVDVSRYVSTLYPGGAAVTVPGRLDGLTSKWRGCIEEANTSAAASFDVNALPNDLDPDFKPSDPANKWRPMWPEAVWLRNPGAFQDVQDGAVDENRPAPNVSFPWPDVTFRAGLTYDRNGSVPCGMRAERLREWTSSEVTNYVYANEFRPAGGTYHDVGMIWGTRMLSPDGVFGRDTAAWPGRNPPSRNIVFMTDGAMRPSLTSYGLYGVEAWDNRVTAGAWSSQEDRHNARFRIECDAAKKKGFTIYVVAVAVGANADLTYCASPGQVFEARSTEQLKTAFKSIAERVAMLRITQ